MNWRKAINAVPDTKRISLAIQRGNAACIMGTLPKSSDFHEKMESISRGAMHMNEKSESQKVSEGSAATPFSAGLEAQRLDLRRHRLNVERALHEIELIEAALEAPLKPPTSPKSVHVAESIPEIVAGPGILKSKKSPKPPQKARKTFFFLGQIKDPNPDSKNYEGAGEATKPNTATAPLTAAPVKEKPNSKKGSFIVEKRKSIIKSATQQPEAEQRSVGYVGVQPQDASDVVSGEAKKRSLGSQEKEQIDETLEKKRYGQDDFSMNATLPSVSEEISMWVEKSIERIFFHLVILTIVASLITAFCCYMFVHLPPVIYSTHIFYEIFLINDDVMVQHGFAKPGSWLRTVTPLPVCILVMFVYILYTVYVVQYPQQTKFVQYLRYAILGCIELYLLICCISYVMDTVDVDDRLDMFFQKDKAIGLIDEKEKLGYLKNAQSYFGCCGYHDRNEWMELDPVKYDKTWPLTCCDEKNSGIACFSPVQEKVSYKITWIDGEDEKDQATAIKDRLQKSQCRDMERTMCYTVASLVNSLIFIFAMLSTCTSVILSKLAVIVTKYDLEIKPKAQVIDFL